MIPHKKRGRLSPAMPIRQPGVNGWEGINCTPGIIYIGKDSGFLNDILFFYAIETVFKMHDLRKIYSSSVTVAFIEIETL